MEHDISWKSFFSDDERYADAINGLGCNGRQIVKDTDLSELDTQMGFLRGSRFSLTSFAGRGKGCVKIRDMVRKAAFGMNFAIIGIEAQEVIDYGIPLRNMTYDAGEYERQAAKIRKAVRKNHQGLSRGEYLYGFRKNSRLYPAVTFILYAGAEEWDGPKSLHDILDFTDIPEELRQMVADYPIHLVEIRKLADTSIFKTDIRQVFDFIRCSEDKNALRQLVEQDTYFQHMEEDAFDVATLYSDAKELIQVKDLYKKEERIDMCKAITELMEDSRAEGVLAGMEAGRAEGIDEKTRTIVLNMLNRGMSDEDIRVLAECEQKLIDEVRSEF